VTLAFFRLRFHFKAIDPLWFPAEGAGNTVRGALGYALRQVACRCGADGHGKDCTYARIFEPRHIARTGPSGFAEWPRPFVLRTRHLDGQVFLPRKPFSFDVHLFDVHGPPLAYFVQAFALIASQGIGAPRRQAKLTSVEQLDSEGLVHGVVWEGKKCASLFEPASVPLVANGAAADSLCIRFLTPTELKCAGGLAPRPDFSVLFARIRDRISTLRALYGAGPLEIDFRSLGGRAAEIAMTRCQINSTHIERRSSRTRQVHPLGGFTGEAEYSGKLAEFLPYLQAARWTGVGRQTVWGKGEISVAS
jgi:CRISPR-associated endoribonuclease Cas6